MSIPAIGRVSSGFGMRMHPILGIRRMHNGIDIAMPLNAPVNAAQAGTVTRVYKSSSYGNVVYIKHAGGYETRYAHLNGFNVKVGDVVRGGQQVGRAGNTGLSRGVHLHFEVRKNGKDSSHPAARS